MRKIKIAPSILSANFATMGADVEMLERCGADYVHCDVMDGSFVNPITFGGQMVKAIRKITKLPLDVHLMIVHPETQVKNFADAGTDILTFHYEAVEAKDDKTKDECVADLLQKIRESGMKAGLVINPATPVSVLKPFVTMVDQILLMTVVAGYGGQSFIPYTLDKIKELRAYTDELGIDLDIEVDGGITEENIATVLEAGANVIVAGSTVFKSSDKERTIRVLRGESV